MKTNIITMAKLPGIFLLFLVLFPFHRASAQLSVSPNKTAAQLAAALVGPGVTIVSSSMNCPSNANGTFTTGSNALSISDGVLLTSGSAANVASNASTFASPEDNGTGGDADLTLLSGNTTFDACVLEFDFIPKGNQISFRYQFGSEEYPDFTCTEFNDVFGFFINGGTEYPLPTNLALVPGTSPGIPVAINTVNGGVGGADGPPANCTGYGQGSPFTQYFIDNTNGPDPVYDGLTKVFVAEASVTPCVTYHFKLGVADASDRMLSSGVFLEKGSLTVPKPTITPCPADITQNTGPGATLCGKTVTWTPPTATNSNSCDPVMVSSDHHPGDFFLVGTTTVTYTFTNSAGSTTCSFNVTVNDNTVPDAKCKDASVTLAGGQADITPADVDAGSTDNCAIASRSVSPNHFTCADAGKKVLVTLTITDIHGNHNSCNAFVTVNGVVPTCHVSVVPCAPNVCTGGVPTNIYLGYGPQCATITANATGGNSFTYSWSPAAGLSCTNCQNAVFTPTTPGNYTFTATVTNDNGCTTMCTVTFCVKDVRAAGNGNNQKIYVCHLPPGNPANAQTLSISINAVPAHVCQHGGDRLGQCDDAPCVSGTSPKGIAGNSFSRDAITVYPNPNSGSFTVDIPYIDEGGARILVTDLQGKVITRKTVGDNDGNQISIELGRVAAGIYLVEVVNGDDHFRTKVTVK